MMKPLNSFTCYQTRKGNRRPMRLLYKPPGPTTSLLLLLTLCSDQIQRVEALTTNLHLVVLKCTHNFFHNFVVILMVMFSLADYLVWNRYYLEARPFISFMFLCHFNMKQVSILWTITQLSLLPTILFRGRVSQKGKLLLVLSYYIQANADFFYKPESGMVSLPTLMSAQSCH